tara:strand:+ start:1646 stop:1750 length:105 start_codon:yes stop_codon:yes gene_type:complete
MKNIKDIKTELKGIRQRIKDKADKIKEGNLKKIA